MIDTSGVVMTPKNRLSESNRLPDISEVTPLSGADQVMVDEVVQVLKKHNALNRFGLTLLHQHFDVGDDEIMIESTDVAGRIQTTKPVQRSKIKSLKFTETAWRLDTGRAVMSCICVKDGDDHSHQDRG